MIGVGVGVGVDMGTEFTDETFEIREAFGDA